MKEGLWPRHIISRSLEKPAGGLVAGESLIGMGRAWGNGGYAVKAAFLAALAEVKREGGEARSVAADMVFPPDAPESAAKDKARILKAMAEKNGVCISSIRGETHAAVKTPEIHVTVVGDKKTSNPLPKEGDEIRILGFTGLMGSLMLSEEGNAELRKRFSKSYIDTFDDEEEGLSVESEKDVAAYYLSGESIFSGLWNFAERAGLGLCVSMLDMPIRQRTVEICEYLGVNPYELRSEGLGITAGGKKGVKIGTFTAPPKRIVMRGEDTSYLSKPQGEALAIWQGEKL